MKNKLCLRLMYLLTYNHYQFQPQADHYQCVKHATQNDNTMLKQLSNSCPENHFAYVQQSHMQVEIV